MKGGWIRPGLSLRCGSFACRCGPRRASPSRTVSSSFFLLLVGLGRLHLSAGSSPNRCQHWVNACGWCHIVVATSQVKSVAHRNTNRRIREYLPKGTDILQHQPYLAAIAEDLNTRPRACLGFYTPQEVFHIQLLEGSGREYCFNALTPP